MGRSSEEEVNITRMLEKVLRRSDALDRESLCILAGKKVSAPSATLQTVHPNFYLGLVYPPDIIVPLR